MNLALLVLVDSLLHSNSAASNGDDVYVSSSGVLRIAEGTSGANSDDMKYNEVLHGFGRYRLQRL